MGVVGGKLAYRKPGWKPEQGGEKGGCGGAYSGESKEDAKMSDASSVSVTRLTPF